MKSDKKIAIVLVNYKAYAKGYLEAAYNSLVDQSYPNSLYSLYIADNSTSTESQKAIKKLAPKAIVITNNENLGWAGGNNSAIRQILTEDYDYILVANMDMEFEKDWLENLIFYAENNKTGITQSKIVLYGKEKINSLGNRIHFLGFGFCNCFGKDASCTIEGEKCRIDYASGAAMLVKKEVFEKIGLFRKEFFMYHDDLEFCWRARLAGFKIGVAEDSVCHHKYKFDSTMTQIYYLERNRLITLFSLEKLGSILLTLPVLIPFELLMTVYFAIRGHLKEKLKANTFIFTNEGRNLIKSIRKEVKTYRTVADKNVVKNFSGKLIFPEIDNPLLSKVMNPVFNLYWKIVSKLIIW